VVTIKANYILKLIFKGHQSYRVGTFGISQNVSILKVINWYWLKSSHMTRNTLLCIVRILLTKISAATLQTHIDSQRIIAVGPVKSPFALMLLSEFNTSNRFVTHRNLILLMTLPFPLKMYKDRLGDQSETFLTLEGCSWLHGRCQ